MSVVLLTGIIIAVVLVGMLLTGIPIAIALGTSSILGMLLSLDFEAALLTYPFSRCWRSRFSSLREIS